MLSHNSEQGALEETSTCLIMNVVKANCVPQAALTKVRPLFSQNESNSKEKYRSWPYKLRGPYLGEKVGVRVGGQAVIDGKPKSPLLVYTVGRNKLATRNHTQRTTSFRTLWIATCHLALLILWHSIEQSQRQSTSIWHLQECLILLWPWSMLTRENNQAEEPLFGMPFDSFYFFTSFDCSVNSAATKPQTQNFVEPRGARMGLKPLWVDVLIVILKLAKWESIDMSVYQFDWLQYYSRYFENHFSDLQSEFSPCHLTISPSNKG